jgi:glycosyltransferase involved in cell wall biosynthesis
MLDPSRLTVQEACGPALLPRLTALDATAFIVHSHLRWDFVWQRPQQIVSRLAQKHPVLFVEEPREDERTMLEVTEPCENVLRAVPLLSDLADLSIDAQHHRIIDLIASSLRTHPRLAGRFDRFVQWFYSPMTAPSALRLLEGEAVVYDCMDELANFRFAPADIATRERLLLEHADVVFTGGRALYESKSRRHPNVHFFGCGVDAAHFGQARRADLPRHTALADLPSPILGYVGVIDERLDYELIAKLAESFPEATIAMVGPTAKVDPAQLPRHANIAWLGQQAYADLPSIIKAFDVCLMPFAINEATRYINPTKTLEYMATGKPVVSTAVPDVVRNFAPVVAVAASADDFVAEVGRALRAPSTERIEQGIAQAQAAGWDTIVSTMSGHIEQVLQRTPERQLRARS